MGAAASTATATNIAQLNASSSVSTSESCSTVQSIAVAETTIVINNLTCGGDLIVAPTKVTQQSNCLNNSTVAVISKVIADQIATSTTKAGVAIPFTISAAVSNSSNFVDIANNISAFIQASCNNQQILNLGKRTFQVGDVVASGDCNIFPLEADQATMCINDIQTSILNDVESRQTAEATATSGLDLADLIKGIIAILALLLLLLIVIPIVITAFTGGTIKNIFTSKKTGQSIGELKGILSGLKAQAEGRAQAAAQGAAQAVQAVPPPA